MPAKPIVIVSHASFEMQRRGISEAEVETVVRNPGQVVPSKKGRQIYQTKIAAGRLLLRVVVKEDAIAYYVITAYKTNKVAKYWKQP